MLIILITLTTAIAVLTALVFLVPRQVRYAERIRIAALVASVYDAVRFQKDLMRWSAWPSATQSTCATENTDGEVGARTVFFSKGKRFGYQEVTALEPDRRVDIALTSAGPPQKPRITYAFEPAGPNATIVTLHWTNEITRPFNVALRLLGIVRWTRAMHLKDLDGLRRFCEPPHETYTGEPARAQSA